MAEEDNTRHWAMFGFEEMFRFTDDRLASFTKYMYEHWTHSILFSVVYLLLIFGVRFYMKGRPGMELRPALAVWSGLLAIFSILGAIRTLPELIAVIKTHSLQYSACVPSYFKGVTGFWAFMFTVSKVYELGDTVFIVLRKQPLIFLHWYHHITVLVYVWYSYPDHTAPGRWFMVMNYTVHSIMYSYYALRALRVAVPRQVNVLITMLQILQMLTGCTLNVWVYLIKTRGDYCQQSYENLFYCTLMYFSYFVLFAHFFYKSYMKSRQKAFMKSKLE